MTFRRVADPISEFLSLVFFRNRLAALIMLALPVAIMIGLFVLPLGAFLRTSLWKLERTTIVPATSFANFEYLLTTPFYRDALVLSVQLSLSVALICLLIGYPVSLILTRRRLRIGGMVAFILFTPLFVSVVVRSFGWLVLLERQGVLNSLLLEVGLIDRPIAFLNSFAGVTIGMVNVLLVFMIVPLVTSLSAVPRNLEEAARTLGANRFRTWWHVTWPLSAPGVITGFLLVFVMTLSSYVLPRLLGGAAFAIYPVQMWRQVMSVLNWPMGAAMGVILIVVALVVSRLVLVAAHVVFPYYRQTTGRRTGARVGR